MAVVVILDADGGLEEVKIKNQVQSNAKMIHTAGGSQRAGPGNKI